MKKIFIIIIGTLFFWAAGSYWSVNWIDKHDYDDFPDKKTLAAARFLWAYSPTIDHDKDTERALKFSWLYATTEIQKKEIKDIPDILRILRDEISFLGKVSEKNLSALSPETKADFYIILLKYINRINILNGRPGHYLSIAIDDLNMAIDKVSQTNQLEWFGETMIYWKLSGNESAYTESKVNFVRVMTSNKYEGRSLPSRFVDGIMNFYDGMLFCAMGDQDNGVLYINAASEKWRYYPSDAYYIFLTNNLNRIFLMRGIIASPKCKEAMMKLTQVDKNGNGNRNN